MSSWEGSACYPRSTFYPLSDGPSMRYRRITMLLFPTCSDCRPLSQAPLCHYTLRPVTNRSEGTFRSLRYAFGGDHPSQTTHQAVSSLLGVRDQMRKGPYFNVDSSMAGATDSQSPDYPTHHAPGSNAKLQERFTGSFRPVAGNRHLHLYYNFTELTAETVSGSLHHSCRSELTRQGISLPEDRYIYGRRLPGLQFNFFSCE